MRPRVAAIVLCLVMSGGPSAAWACSGPTPRTFPEVLDAAESVAIVRIEAIALQRKGRQELEFMPDLAADVRVVETLLGEPAVVNTLEYSSHWCGGHRLNVGDYNVLLLERNQPHITLPFDDPSIVSLFDEYDEHNGSKESRSTLLMHLRNYARVGSIPETFPIHDWLEATRVRTARPPIQGRLNPARRPAAALDRPADPSAAVPTQPRRFSPVELPST